MVVPSLAAVFISMLAPLFLKNDKKSLGRLMRTASHSTEAPYDLKIYTPAYKYHQNLFTLNKVASLIYFIDVHIVFLN